MQSVLSCARLVCAPFDSAGLGRRGYVGGGADADGGAVL